MLKAQFLREYWPLREPRKNQLTCFVKQLSRLTSETRTFSGVGSYPLSYSYNLAGELTGITNPWNAQVGYTYDSTGRPTSVSGANYAGVSSYVNSISYRAFGLEQMAYGNGRTLSLSYDNRLRLTRWETPGVMGWNYVYNNFGESGGRVTFAQSLNDATLDRSYYYDQAARLIDVHTGAATVFLPTHSASSYWYRSATAPSTTFPRRIVPPIA